MTSVEPFYEGRALYGRVLLLAGGLFLSGTNAVVIAGLLPHIASSLHTTPTSVSFTISIYALVVAIGAPLIAAFLPRVPRWMLISGGMLVLGVGTLVAALSHDLVIFALGRFISAFGGAAMLPAATAAAAAIAPPERRGRAIAIVATGFTLAPAIGSPIGTAVGASVGWEIPLFGVVGLAVVLAAANAIFVRRIPLGPPTSLGQRLASLKNARVLTVLIGVLTLVAAFNLVYIFSSAFTAPATGGKGQLLAVLLLVFGVGGIVGSLAAGVLTDRLGNRPTATTALAVHALALIGMYLLTSSFLATAILFAVWGIAQTAAIPPLQHRLVQLDQGRATMVLSWYTTVMYVGIGIAPPIGAAALAIAGPPLIPLFGAGLTVLALLAFMFSYANRRKNISPLV
jgi:DHA1 family inner membrane transport protein